MTGDQVTKLRQQILGMISPDAAVKLHATKEEILSVATALSNTGLSFDTIQKILPKITEGAVASKTDFSLYSQTVGDFVDKYKVKAEDLGAVQDALNETLKLPDIRGHANEYLQGLEAIQRVSHNIHVEGKQDVITMMAMQAQLTSVSGNVGTANEEFTQFIQQLYLFGKQGMSMRGSPQAQLYRVDIRHYLAPATPGIKLP